MVKIKRIKRKILKTYVDIVSYEQAIERIIYWAKNRDTKYVSIMNINDLVKSWIDIDYRKITSKADLSSPDGAPLAFILRLYGFREQKRVTGPDLMYKLIPILANLNLKILFYGSTNEILEKISRKIKKSYNCENFYFKSPPFRELTKEEDIQISREIRKLNPHLIFVGLGCPKQDLWIFEKKQLINSVFIGVGAAFDFYADESKRAPSFMQDNGLEWLYRLYQNPRKLFKRYFKNIFLFTIGIIIQFFGEIKKYFRN